MAERPAHEDWKPDILTQLQEQSRALRQDVAEHSESDREMFQRIESAIRDLRTSLDGKFVTKEEFNPTRMISYGVVAVLMTAVLMTIFAFVVVGKSRIAP